MIAHCRFPSIAALLLLSVGLTTLAGTQSTSPSGAAAVRGNVYDAQRHPVAAVDVSLQAAHTQIWKTRSDAGGAFTFSALPQGSYTIRAEDSKHKVASASVTLAAGQRKIIDLTLSDAEPAFFDEPTFSVAGVTDTTNLGGHGSNTVVQTKNALARATVSLSKDANSSKPETTESALREAQKQKPASFAANYELAKFLVDGGRVVEAKPFLARASGIELGNDSLRAQEKGGLHHLLGEIAEQGGDPVAAVREYQRAAELDPNESNIFDWGAELLLHHAPEPAAEVFSSGHRRFPQSARMLIGLGVAWYVRGSYEQAARRFCEAAELTPGDPTPYLFLGKILNAESGVSPEIADRLAGFAEREPQNAMVNYDFAVSLWKQRKPGDQDTAARVQGLLEKAVALDSQLSEAFLQLGIVHLERKNFPQAIAAYRHAIAVNPKMEQAHYRLAQAYRLSGQPEQAQSELKIFETLSKENESELERERRDIKQFVYTVRGEKSASSPH